MNNSFKIIFSMCTILIYAVFDTQSNSALSANRHFLLHIYLLCYPLSKFAYCGNFAAHCGQNIYNLSYQKIFARITFSYKTLLSVTLCKISRNVSPVTYVRACVFMCKYFMHTNIYTYSFKYDYVFLSM